jgi:hypothetical protein
MQLYRAGYLKYDSGHNFFPIEERFHVDTEQIRDGYVVLALRRGKIVFPSPNITTVHSYGYVGMGSLKEKE